MVPLLDQHRARSPIEFSERIQAMTEYFNRHANRERRRELRNNMTKPEVLLWIGLKGRKLEGCRFRRQFGIGEYILDFFCPELNFGIEVDGHSHYTDEGKTHDQRRQDFLDSLGIKIARVLNSDVYDNIDGVWEHLRRAVKELRAGGSTEKEGSSGVP